jgi:hypothetical protein
MSWQRHQIGRALSLILIVPTLQGAQNPENRLETQPARSDAVTYKMPTDAAVRSRVTRSANWLRKHVVSVTRTGDAIPIRVIAWKDPTLEPVDPKLLAGYAITDTLWAAKALTLFDPAASHEMEDSLRRLGWPGNGLHDVLFHPLDKILHRSADADVVHGFSLGRYPIADGQTVDVRVFRQKWDASYDVGHPLLFAEHAVYRALHDFWQGRSREARRRVLDVTLENRTAIVPDHVFWDPTAGVLVDFVNHGDWLAFQDGRRAVCRHYTFKLGVLLYAIRLLGLEEEVGAPLKGMKERLWSAQTPSGGLAHFVDVRTDGTLTTGRQPTGEASAIAILAEVVEARRAGGR